MANIEITGPTYIHQSQATNYQKCINMYPTAPGPGGRGKATLLPRAGLLSIANLGTSTIRGILAIGNIIYVVGDNKFFKVTIDIEQRTASFLQKGIINNYVGHVELSSNATQIMIVNGTAQGYIYNYVTDTFSTISDGQFVGGSTVAFLDGYFLYAPGGSQLFYASELQDGLVYDALDVATAEYKNDNIVKLATKKRELWILGEHSVEVWYDAANASGMPLSPRIGTEIGIGCRSAASVANVNNTLFWLDDRGFVVAAVDTNSVTNNTSGHDAAIVSDDALHSLWATYEDGPNAVGLGFQENGHLMYQVTWPRDRKTWAYDITTQLWHERSFYNSGRGEDEAHLLFYGVQIDHLTVGGGPSGGMLYIMHTDYLDDNGANFHCIKTSSPFYQEFKKIGIDCLQVRCDSGKATQTGLGADPQISLRYSHDGGHTWSSHLARSLGKAGEYGKEIRWNRLGSGLEWVFEFTIVEPIKFAIVEASVDITEVEGY